MVKKACAFSCTLKDIALTLDEWTIDNGLAPRLKLKAFSDAGRGTDIS